MVEFAVFLLAISIIRMLLFFRAVLLAQTGDEEAASRAAQRGIGFDRAG